MACFLVPAAEAAVLTVINKTVLSGKTNEKTEESSAEHKASVPFAQKLKWLTNLLWGGSALLAFEHLWHGEIVPWAPFLTAAANPEDTAVMLSEMSTVGVSMAVLITLVWAAVVIGTNYIVKKPAVDIKISE